ncbi:TraM recognition domain-containing protein [Jiangella alba]|uniref:TraM recognition site of TraD and TraG n=1 Tax=Jiangella alba TaxID=561176 RepID=A0A1H5N123_9ACTN|nr:TraM recognition domain-containing protein [Jiangella alba]SEE94657.1 TraM recognition site of TraD and TraG [Jiangella alba]
MNGRPGTTDDTLTNLGLGLLAAAVAGLGLLRAAASITAALTGRPQPDAGLTGGVAALQRPLEVDDAFASPGLSAGLYWTVVAATIGAVSFAAVVGWRLIRTRPATMRSRLARLAGGASRSEVTHAASPAALRRRAAVLRPSVRNPRPDDVGYFVGTSRGRQVWVTVEDSILLIGPPRSGKGVHIVISAILDAPGAVVTTSSRPDNVAATMRARERRGPVAVFDPERLVPGLPAGLRWSPVRGCEDALTAMVRAGGLATATSFSTVTNGDFWQGKTTAALQALLHAAALDARDTATLYRWALNPVAAGDAVRILQTNPAAADGWADSLDAMLSADPRTRDSIWQGVSLAMAPLADPGVLDAVSPRRGDSFDPEAFLRDGGTLYLLASGAAANASAPLVAAFVEDLTQTARRLAARSPGARLDPPLLLALDEIGNRAPLPSLPTLMADGGGSGITTMPVLQSMARARENWGDHNAAAIWDSAIVKIVLGGGSDSRELQDLSALLGERDEHTEAVTVERGGGRSTQRSVRRMPVMSADMLRMLPFGTAVVLLRTTPPIITRLRPWTRRPDGKQLARDRAAVEHLIRPS